MDEHISEYSSFEAFCISVCSSLHTEAYSLSESIGPSTGFIHFWSSCRPRELHTEAYPPSSRSSDLSQASLSFDLVVDPHKLSYGDISSPSEFACFIIWVILWLWATWSDPYLVSFNLSRGRTYIDRSSPCHASSVWVGAAPISIGHLIFISVQFLGPHLYRSVIIVLVWVGAAPISIGHLIFMSVQFLGPHLYRSVIIVSVWVEAAPISIGHYRVSLSRGRTYINRPSRSEEHTSELQSRQ